MQIVSEEWARGFQAAADIVRNVEDGRSMLAAASRSPYAALKCWAKDLRVIPKVPAEIDLIPSASGWSVEAHGS